MDDLRPPYPNELYHYGILGMKWGVRRFQNRDGTLTSAGKKRYSNSEPPKRIIKNGKIMKRKTKEEKLQDASEDYKVYNNLKSKKSYEMSNKELEIYIKRADLEKKYSQMHGSTTFNDQKKRGMDAVNDVLWGVVKDNAKRELNSGIRKALHG